MPSHTYEPRDLTARARIRDTALEQFAEHGFASATMRAIGDAAEVSLGLVQHHFGSKDGLRAACDEFVIEVFRHRLLVLNDKGQLANPNALADLAVQAPLLLRYLARSAVDDSDAARDVFALLAEGAEEFLSSTWPDRFPPDAEQTRDTAAVMTAMHSGIAILLGPIAHRMGVDTATAQDSMRIGAAVMNLYGVMGQFTASATGEGIQAAMQTLREETAAEQETTTDMRTKENE
ncbi:TetR family transcriptional regulator [Pseudoclavibacter endophyticus]|uniref:TetR/AcrR family transcriptional regulator n=1 Tax=Pseudoclavibacter endophyticus TaxID=1778590 RepID=UPI00166AB91F|nr:TetR/AcrR family transcriptional regulator [Pseudoclavibacter endophyticus]GGA76243.1 TetR family transcriptional regulator [Pseudoclavibacter endophyticus]